jgi:hypothetical protein
LWQSDGGGGASAGPSLGFQLRASSDSGRLGESAAPADVAPVWPKASAANQTRELHLGGRQQIESKSPPPGQSAILTTAWPNRNCSTGAPAGQRGPVGNNSSGGNNNNNNNDNNESRSQFTRKGKYALGHKRTQN